MQGNILLFIFLLYNFKFTELDVEAVQMENVAMVLLLANASSGVNKNLCFVNAVVQIILKIPQFR